MFQENKVTGGASVARLSYLLSTTEPSLHPAYLNKLRDTWFFVSTSAHIKETDICWTYLYISIFNHFDWQSPTFLFLMNTMATDLISNNVDKRLKFGLWSLTMVLLATLLLLFFFLFCWVCSTIAARRTSFPNKRKIDFFKIIIQLKSLMLSRYISSGASSGKYFKLISACVLFW